MMRDKTVRGLHESFLSAVEQEQNRRRWDTCPRACHHTEDLKEHTHARCAIRAARTAQGCVEVCVEKDRLCVALRIFRRDSDNHIGQVGVRVGDVVVEKVEAKRSGGTVYREIDVHVVRPRGRYLIHKLPGAVDDIPFGGLHSWSRDNPWPDALGEIARVRQHAFFAEPRLIRSADTDGCGDVEEHGPSRKCREGRHPPQRQ